MSLLLDALKKAAEKKAQKSGQAAAGTDDTRVDTTRVDTTRVEPTETTESLTRTERMDATEVDATEVDETHVETQRLDAGEYEQTQIDTIRIDATEVDETHVETQRLDAGEYEQTQVDDTRIDETEVDATEVDETHVQTQRLDAGEYEQTQVDTTRIDETEVDATGIDETHVETQRLDAGEYEQTQVDDTRIDETEVDATEVDETHVETQRLDAGEYKQTQVDNTRIDETEVDATEVDETHIETQRLGAGEQSALETDTTEFSAIDTTADPTMLVMDDSIPVDAEGNTLIETDDFTAEELARLREASRPELTEDDVTAFMGDGHVRRHDIDTTSATRTVEMRPVTLDDIPAVDDSQLGSDDTTLTNPEDRTQLAMDDTTASGLPPGVEPPAPEPEIDEDEQSTVINPESHGAAIDLDRLTHEETLGAQTSTSGRTFAPDNYDRTLIKLSESDVSRIFPGMKPPEPGAVMTPDYAKKVFMSKSSRHRGNYLKWMGIVGLVLLLVVGLWGLYDLSEESDRIDSSLVRLKRDPMPGVIQPPKEEKIELFAPPAQDDAKALSTETVATETRPEATAGQTGAASSTSGDEMIAQVDAEAIEAAAASAPAEQTAAPARSATASAAATPAAIPAASPQPRPASLQLSSSERVDDKDRMLGDAYAAYEQGDLAQARRLYAAVLEQDPENRDALLGMAAIEVQDGDYNRAIELYQKLLLLNPKDAEAMASLVAVANIDPQRGETRIKQMLAEQPDSPYLYFTLGNMYSRQQRWAEAQAAYFQALQLRPDDPNTAYNLAVSLEHLGKPEVARNYYMRALANRDRALATFDADQVAQRVEVLSQ